jgi:putative DNA methylase
MSGVPNVQCKPHHQGRFFKKPDDDDLAKYREAEVAWARMTPSFVPDDEIPPGDETDRLHRWGYRGYREMFNARQSLGSVHGFPVGLVQCESNFLGIPAKNLGANVGSGGWSNIIEKYTTAKAYCERPFEVRDQGAKKVQVFVSGEWIGDQRSGSGEAERRHATLHSESATVADIPEASLDEVLTDPPYFGNVQYAELMDFCYVWLRRLVGTTTGALRPPSTRHVNELTGNVTLERGLSHFTQGLSEVFSRMAKALKPGGPFAFTYHHNTVEAYFPIAVAILDAGLTCSASIPCPAEMGGQSISMELVHPLLIPFLSAAQQAKCRAVGLLRAPRRLQALFAMMSSICRPVKSRLRGVISDV